MNCLHTRRSLLAEPNAASSALSSHLEECGACRQFALRLAQNETLLHTAIAIPAPEQLSERILLRAKLRSRSPDWFRWIGDWLQPRRTAYAVVASVALSFGLWWSLPSSERPVQWSEVVLAHVIGESGALANGVPQSLHALNIALKDYGLTLNPKMGAVRYFDRCALPGGRGIHAVIETPDFGKITLILPPLGTRAESGSSVREGFAAQIVLIDQTSVGLVSDRPEHMGALTVRLREQLVKST